MVGAGAVEKKYGSGSDIKKNTAPAPTKTLRLRLRNPAHDIQNWK